MRFSENILDNGLENNPSKLFVRNLLKNIYKNRPYKTPYKHPIRDLRMLKIPPIMKFSASVFKTCI